MDGIYLDHAAATPTDPRVLTAMARASRNFGNPSSFNDAGRAAARELAAARTTVAGFLNARPDEIVFCASGSEANTLALLGHRNLGATPAVITSPTEHLSVLECVGELERRGARVIRAPVDACGRIDVDAVMRSVDRRTRLISLMYANNEIGTIHPIGRLGRLLGRWRRSQQVRWPLLHVDACQATTTLDMDVQRLGVDLLTFNGAKAYGPHGGAVLFVRRGVELGPRVLGGEQEAGRRAGTEDVATAAGIAAALALVKPGEGGRLAALRDRLISGILGEIPDARLNGAAGDERLAGNVNVSIPCTDSESLLLELDRVGIRAGSGSACTAHSVEPSHVLKAVRTPAPFLSGVLRFSLGRGTTRAQIDAVIRALPAAVERIRRRHRKGRTS